MVSAGVQLFIIPPIALVQYARITYKPGMLLGKRFITGPLMGEVVEYRERFKDLHEKVHWTMWDKFGTIKHKAVENYATFNYSATPPEGYL